MQHLRRRDTGQPTARHGSQGDAVELRGVGGIVDADGRQDPARNKKSPQGEGGPIERAVRADVGALFSEHPMGESLSEVAFMLARSLDAGAGQMEASLSRELRVTLEALAGMGVGGDSDLDAALSTPSRPDVPSEVRDPEEP